MQGYIMDKFDSSSFSKYNYETLKTKLNDIAHDLYTVDNKYKRKIHSTI